MTDESQRYGKSNFACPYCGVSAQQNWSYLIAEPIDPGSDVLFLREKVVVTTPEMAIAMSEMGFPLTEDGVITRFAMKQTNNLTRKNADGSGVGVGGMKLSECQVCKRVCVWEHETLIHPRALSAPPPQQGMPEKIVEIYNEARSISGQSPRSAAALLRLCLEELLKDQKVGEGKLNTMIGSAVKMGVGEEAQQAMDILRLYGNDSIHQHKGKIDLSEVEGVEGILFDLINFVVFELITRPAKFNSMFGAMPEEKRDGIAQRDKSD